MLEAIMMIDSGEKGTSELKVDARATFFAQSCGAVDERKCNMMKQCDPGRDAKIQHSLAVSS